MINEAARIIIVRHKRAGRPVEDLYRDQASFQNSIIELKAAMERDLLADEIIGFDRGTPSLVAYCRLHGLDERVAFDVSQKRIYRRVFLLEPLPALANDYARKFDSMHALRLHDIMIQSYIDAGYPLGDTLIPVPIFNEDRKESIRSRLEFIQERL